MQKRLKRAIDVTGAGIGLLLALPILAVVAIAIRLSMGRPCIFRQLRAGINGHVFEIRKFRTMTDARDVHGRLFPDRERLTRVGRFIRNTSFDELPQLWNVLWGHMSLVGPRPLLA